MAAFYDLVYFTFLFLDLRASRDVVMLSISRCACDVTQPRDEMRRLFCETLRLDEVRSVLHQVSLVRTRYCELMAVEEMSLLVNG